MTSIGYWQADLAGGATFNPKIWALPPLVLEEVRWILHAENAQQAASPAAQHAAGQASQEMLQNKAVRKHTRLYCTMPVLEATLVCAAGGAKRPGSLFVTVTQGHMAKLAFHSV